MSLTMLNRTAFVTGAAQGLGKAFSEALLERGARVCLTDIQRAKGQALESTLQKKYGSDKVMFRQCDVTSKDSVKESFSSAVDQFGCVNLMVNNAGIANESQLVNMVNINLIAMIEGSNLAVDHMRKDKGGSGGVIVNMASTAGLQGVYVCPHYCASKFGVLGFHHSWVMNPHCKEMGIQFACICPAFTDTDIINFNEGKVGYPEEAVAFLKYVGMNKVESVVQGFLKLVEAENCHGDIVTITSTEGIKYVRRGGKRVPLASKM